MDKTYNIMQALQMRDLDERGMAVGYTIKGTDRDTLIKELVRILTESIVNQTV